MWVDGHLDLAYLAVNGRDLRLPCSDPTAGCLSLPDLREGDVRVALATIFTEIAGSGGPGTCSPHDAPHVYRSINDLHGAFAAGMRQLELYERLEREGCVRIVRTRRDLDFVGDDEGLLRIVILMEGADPIRSPDELALWFERGVRAIGLTWAMGSRYAGGNAAPGRLTTLGMELAHAIDDLGVIHDISHLADDAWEQLAAMARGPIVASHSNARALATPSERHLRDDQIHWLAERGGIIGLNLFKRFLSPTRDGTLRDVVKHANYMADLIGRRDGLALGSDMDGGFPASDLATGLEHPRKLNALAAAMRESGWSEQEVRGFQSENWLRFLRSALPV